MRTKNPEYKIIKYETKAFEYWKKVKAKVRQDIEKDKKRLYAKEKDGLSSEQELQGNISMHEKQLEMETAYFRLKEKFKHDTDQKIKITIDWYDYVTTLDELNSLGEGFQYGAYKDMSMEEIDDEYRELRIKRDEIQKKFHKLIEE